MAEYPWRLYRHVQETTVKKTHPSQKAALFLLAFSPIRLFSHLEKSHTSVTQPSASVQPRGYCKIPWLGYNTSSPDWACNYLFLSLKMNFWTLSLQLSQLFLTFSQWDAACTAAVGLLASTSLQISSLLFLALPSGTSASHPKQTCPSTCSGPAWSHRSLDW